MWSSTLPLSSVVFAAVSCPPLALRVVSSAVTSVGTQVNVSCPAGQKLRTGHKMMKAFCTRSGHWSPEVSDCIGEPCRFSDASLVFLKNPLLIQCESKKSPPPLRPAVF